MNKATDYIANIDNAERRFITTPTEVRAEGEDQYFEGYAAKFNQRTELWKGFFEEVATGAFDEVVNDDVRGLFNHDPNQVLGRTASGTMTVTVDEVGAKYSIKYNPNDPDHVRVMEKVKRGDVSQSSFAFTIKEQAWERNEKAGTTVRTIKKLEKWYDVAPVTYPAYNDTTVAARGLSNVEKSEEDKASERSSYWKKLYETKIK